MKEQLTFFGRKALTNYSVEQNSVRNINLDELNKITCISKKQFNKLFNSYINDEATGRQFLPSLIRKESSTDLLKDAINELDDGVEASKRIAEMIKIFIKSFSMDGTGFRKFLIGRIGMLQIYSQGLEPKPNVPGLSAAQSYSTYSGKDEDEGEDESEAIQLSIMQNRLGDLENANKKRSLNTEEKEERDYLHRKLQAAASKTENWTVLPRAHESLQGPYDRNFCMM
jgi:hypothetical protein